MDSKPFSVFWLLVLLAGCTGYATDVSTPENNKGYPDSANVTYWHPTRVTSDNTPNIVKAQEMLEDDLVACGYELRDHRRWAINNDPVSNENGQVVRKKGVLRAETILPTTYELSACMNGKGWVRLKEYYQTPY